MSETATKPIDLLIVDDSEVVRAGLRSLLGGYPTLAIVGEASSAAMAVAEAMRLKPQVVLLDLRLPDGTGFEVCRQILRELPDAHVLILTSVMENHMVYEAIQAGAQGYLLKEIDPQGLVNAILDVAAGKSILDPALTTRVMDIVKAAGQNPAEERLALLSVQERRVLERIAEGKTNKEAGLDLNLSEKTVRNYLSNIFNKLNVSRRSQAVAVFSSIKHSGGHS